MTLESVFAYLIIWSAIGFLAFSVYVVLALRTGIVYTARKQDGKLKERIPLSGIVNMLILLMPIIGFQVLANYFGLVCNNFEINFFTLFLLNFWHFKILFIFDSSIIDGVVHSLWRPKILNLPQTIGRDSMIEQLLLSIPVGTLAAVILTILSSSISTLLFFR